MISLVHNLSLSSPDIYISQNVSITYLGSLPSANHPQYGNTPRPFLTREFHTFPQHPPTHAPMAQRPVECHTFDTPNVEILPQCPHNLHARYRHIAYAG
jgi:hypothetical protein